MLTGIALVVLLALLGNLVFEKLGLPGILGMIAAGVLLGPHGFDQIQPEVLGLLGETRTAALIVILIRAGLGINRDTLHRIGRPAIRMGFIPSLLEGTAVTAASYFLLGLSFVESGMLGFILAAVSPAVVIPAMLDLKDEGLGKKHEVPTLVLSGTSMDVVVAITVFGVFAGLAAGGSADWTYLLLGVPSGILLGGAIGVGIGLAFMWIFGRFEVPDTMKVILFMIVAVVFYDFAARPAVRQILPIAALLGIMASGFVILEKNSDLAHRLASKFAQVWVLAEILLFVYIGTEVRIDALDPGLIGLGLGILAIGLAARSLGVRISLRSSDLSPEERRFCAIAYLPKATVQAAMGAVPLAMVLDGRATSMTLESGETILSIAVLAIVVAAPVGAVAIQYFAPRLLTRD
jgi:NhaP-type Na+/H+ or K+/H+ antiporter